MRGLVKSIQVRRPICLICAVLLMIILIITGKESIEPSINACMRDAENITITGVIEEIKAKNEKYQLYIKDIREYRLRGVVVYMDDSDIYDLHLGQSIRLKGKFALFDKPYNEGEFDARKYYSIRGYDGKITRVRLLGKSKDYAYIKDALRKLRCKCLAVINEHMNEEDAGVLGAMLLGDKTELDAQDKELYQNAGISHVLALSGLHIAIVGLGLIKLLKRINVPYGIASILSGFLIALYTVMTGLSNSTIRAMIMFVLAVIGNLINRTYDLITAAALSAVVILICNPYYIYDSGFLLSFGAIIGIGIVHPVLEDIFATLLKGKYSSKDIDKNEITIIENVRHKIEEKVKTLGNGMFVSASITLVTLPVVATSFYQISVFSLLLNLLVIPLMSIVLIFGFVGILFGLMGSVLNCDIGGLIWSLCDKTLKISDVIINIYRLLAEEITGFEANLLIIGKPDMKRNILYALMVTVGLIIGGKNYHETSVDRVGLGISSNSAWNVMKTKNKITRLFYKSKKGDYPSKNKGLRQIMSLVILGIACILLCKRDIGDIEIRNMYVGQGDSCLIMGRNIPNILIDGGSTDKSDVGKYTIIPVLKANGVKVIDYCFLTHMDADHINGIFEILKDNNCGLTIKNIVVSESFYNCFAHDTYNGREIEEKENNRFTVDFTILQKAIENKKVNIITIKSDDVFSLGDLKVRCLNPVSNEEYNGNDSSIVLELTYIENEKKTFKALFTGDISSDVEEKIANKITGVTYLKIAHHGSKYSSSSEFINTVNPKLAVISAGINNSYGHPHKETLERLGRYAPGVKVLRTDESGQITVKVNKGNISIERFVIAQ